MVLSGYVKRKIVSIIGPWLTSRSREEAVWEVKIGLVSTVVVVSNLQLDVSLFNNPIISISSVVVDRIVFRLSHFSSPALSFHLHGLLLSLSLSNEPISEPPLDVSLHHYLAQTNSSSFSQLDPQGSALRQTIDTLMMAASHQTRIMDSITNLFLSHCSLHFHHPRLTANFPVSPHNFACLCSSTDIILQSSPHPITSLFTAFIALLFIPFRQTSFTIHATHLQLAAHNNNHTTPIISCVNPSVGLTITDLHLANATLSFPELNFSSSPEQLQMLLACTNLFTIGCKCIRSGRLLWKIARFKIRTALRPPRYVFYELVLAAVLWLRLLKEYQAFLALVGYPEHGLKILTGTKFLTEADRHWQRFSQLEKTKLPVEGVASAWRIARHRAARKASCGGVYGVSHVNSEFVSYWKIFLPLFVIWRATLNSFGRFRTFILRMLPSNVDRSKMIFTVVDPRCCVYLSMGKISATFSLDGARPITRKSSSKERASKADLISFFLSAKEVLFIYEGGICEQHTSVSLGFLKISSAAVPLGSENEISNQNLRKNSEENQAGSNTIAWVEPALTGCHLSTGEIGYEPIPQLKELAREMEHAWNRTRSIFQENESCYGGNPWAICSIHTSWAYQGSQSPYHGLLKCNFIVGKANLALCHSSVVSIATLMEQVQHTFYQYNSPLHSSRNLLDMQNINLQKSSSLNTLKSIVQGLKMTLYKSLPDKHLEVKGVILGPCLHVSFSKEGLLGSPSDPIAVHIPDEVNFIFDIYNTYVTVSPTAMPIASGEHQGLSDDFESESSKLQENMVSGFHESGNVEYTSRSQISHFCYLRLDGLSVDLENLVGNDQTHILLLKPVTVKLSSIREYLYSFGGSVVVSSLSLHGVMSGATVLFYMDEMFAISQVVERLFTVASVPDSSDSAFKAAQNNQVILENQIQQTVFMNEDLLTGSDEVTLTLQSHFFSITTSFELAPFDIIFHNSRNITDVRYFLLLLDAYDIRMPDFAEPSCTGIWLSVQRSCIHVSVGEAKVKVDATGDGFHVVLFKHKNPTGDADKSDIKDTILQCIDCLHEASLSTYSFTLVLDCLSDSKLMNEADSATSNGHSKSLVSDRPRTASCQLPNSDHILDEGIKSDVAPSHWLLLNITVGVIFMGPFTVKNDVLSANVVDKLQLSVSVGGEFQSILMEIQGGLIIIDMLAPVKFARCLTLYLYFVKTLLYMEHSHRMSKKLTEPIVNGPLGTELSEESAQRNTSPDSAVRRELLEACSIHLSHFSLVLISQDESGVLREIIGRITFVLKLWLEDRKQKLSFDLSHLEILSQNLYGGVRETERRNQLPRFSSVRSSDEPVLSNQDNTPEASLGSEKVFFLPKNASCTKPPLSMESSSTSGSSSPVVQTTGSCILERMTSSISAESVYLFSEDDQHCVAQGWFGRGSISGLNLTISLSEIKMLMAVSESFSEVSGKGASTSVMEKTWLSADQSFDNNLETMLPEGAIVAIQDIHQHMYVTIESVEDQYRVAGAVHYSAAGKQALFSVKWQKQKRWKFSTSWFSLVSLYAKTASGDPLRLNYSTSSSFVDISSSNDSACALWKITSPKHEDFEDDIDLRPLSYLSRNTFYLVNKKSDSAAAFVHGAFEFVKKPGNPFKFKIFPGLSLTRDILTSGSHLLSANGPVLMEAQNVADQAQIVPCITLTVEKVSLTVVHELSDDRDKLPLLQGSINDTELTVQVFPLKTRIITTFTTMLYYFDSYKYIWRDLVQPIETCIYWRSTTHKSPEEKSSHGMHSRLYVRLQELDFSLTELSLDILLYLIGKLGLAGPFAVKSSSILANCCKVENQLELDLLCHFDDSQSARVGRNFSTFFSLRHLVNQPLEASYVSICLEIPGMSSTSSIRVPLQKNQVFAWRTRIKSLQDTKSHPGPFIVFDISKSVEEGLSLSISPLLRIHNQTGFSVELRIQRPGLAEGEFVSVLLKEGETIDDCAAAFDAISLVGGPKKVLRSFGVGNFVFSFKPEMKVVTKRFCNISSVDWSDNLEGGKAVRLSGVINKFNYQFRKALSADSRKYSFSTADCLVVSGNAYEAKMYFLVQSIARDMPVMQPNDDSTSKISPIALQEQKEIILLPTVRVSNLLESDIDVLLSETEISTIDGLLNINQANIPFGTTVDLYADPAVIFFTITLTMFGSSCKTVNCGQLLKKLSKKKTGVHFLDIDLEFCRGQYFACLRLARSKKGMLEAIVYTQYSLRNDTEYPLFCSTQNLKPSTREHSTTTAPHLGSFLPPKSIRSWFMKSSKLYITLLDEESSESTLDLDALSGRSEMSFTKLKGSGFIQLVKLGISLGPLINKIDVPAREVSLVPRYVVSNESEERTFVRQCFEEDGFGETLAISSKQKKALSLRVGSRDKQDITVFDKLLRKHKVSDDDFSVFVQFTPNESMLGWSGPVCVASLGRFFLKFKRSIGSPVSQSARETREYDTTWEFAAVNVVEETSTFVLNFYKPPDIALPYRIENHLCDASITYYQKDTFEPETLASKGSVYYVWDDLIRPRKLVVKINGIEILREISLDKLRPWKPFSRMIRQQREMSSKLPSDCRVSVHRGTNAVLMNSTDVENLGYEVCADGPTRVLRICLSPGSRIEDRNFHSSKMIQLRVSYFAIRLLEHFKQDSAEDANTNDLSTYTPIIVGRLENISLDSIILDQRKYNQFRVQSLNVDEKLAGAPFAAMLRRHFASGYDADGSILFVVFVLYPTSSIVREVKYSSVVLQPIDLNIDEETLMKLVPFWRTSLSTNTQSQQYYFDHFEVHPIKIVASFLPEDSYSSYSSGQETLRSLLHSVIKIPAIKNLVVELNGVLVTHALVTTRELLLRCGRHYSWYSLRAIYIAKGSQLLPPTFASVFDDLASSSLDVFFDPSTSLLNVRGLTIGTFKLISKCIENKGISGTKRYFGDLSKTLKTAGSSILFAAVTEVTDSVLKGAESSGLNGMVTGFHHGILKLAMEPSVLGTAFLEGGPDRKIKLDRSPGVDELYIEGYLQAMLDTIYKQEYLRVRVIDDQVILKNLPPNSSLMDEIMDRVKDFLVSKTLLKGDYSNMSRPLRHLRGDNEWRIGPTVLTLCEHLFVSFAIRMLRKQTNKGIRKLKLRGKGVGSREEEKPSGSTREARSMIWRWGIGKFVLSAAVAYIDGRLCRCIPNPVARRIVSGFLLSFLDNDDAK